MELIQDHFENIFAFCNAESKYNISMTCKTWHNYFTHFIKPTIFQLQLALKKKYKQASLYAVNHMSFNEDSPQLTDLLQQALCLATSAGFDEVVEILLTNYQLDPNKDKPIQIAVQNNYPKIVELLLKTGKVHTKDYFPGIIRFAMQMKQIDSLKIFHNMGLLNDSRFLSACTLGFGEVVRWMISIGYDPSIDNCQALELATTNGSTLVVRELLLSNKMNDISKHKSFCIAAKNGFYEIMNLLLSLGNVNPAWNKNEALRLACISESEECVKLLLSRNEVDPGDNDNAALCCAVMGDNSQIVKMLLATNKVDPCTRMNFPLQYATANNDIEVVKLLLKTGKADPTKPEENNCIHIAIKQENISILKLFQRFFDARNYIHYACEVNAIKVVKWMLSTGVHPSFHENIALCTACKVGNEEIVDILLKTDQVDPAARDNYPLRIACRYGYVNIVKKLLETKKVLPSACDDEPLCVACEQGFEQIVDTLIATKDVNVSARRNYPLRIAHAKGFRSIVEKLIATRKVDAYLIRR